MLAEESQGALAAGTSSAALGHQNAHASNAPAAITTPISKGDKLIFITVSLANV